MTGQAYSKTPTTVTLRSEQGETSAHGVAPLCDRENIDLDKDQKTARGGRGEIGKMAIGLAIGLAIGIFASSMSRTPPPTSPQSTVPEKSAAQPAAITTAPSQTVTVAPVEIGTIARTISATGTVAAYDLLPLLPQANGLQIERVLVDEGDVVVAGQVMAVLDDDVLQAQKSQAIAALESAKANLLERQAAVTQAESSVAQALSALAEEEAEKEQARASLAQARVDRGQADRELARYEKLETDGAISLQELEIRSTTASSAAEAVRVARANISSAQAKIQSAQANVSSAKARLKSAKAAVSSGEANVRSAQASVQQLQTQLEQTEVRAPAGGIVAERIARRGDVTNGSQKLFSIIADNALELQVQIPETQLSRVQVGMPVEITSDADARISLPSGIVRSIAPLVDATTRQATLKIDLPSDFSGTVPLLRPGMFLRAAITSQTVEGLTVPYEAVQWQTDGGAIVYLLDGDNVARSQQVEVGNSIGGKNSRIEIKQGLKNGDRVIVAGAGFVKDGDRVKVVPEASVNQSEAL